MKEYCTFPVSLSLTRGSQSILPPHQVFMLTNANIYFKGIREVPVNPVSQQANKNISLNMIDYLLQNTSVVYYSFYTCKTLKIWPTTSMY